MLEPVLTPRPDQAAVLWFTGLSGSGKTTVAREVVRVLAAAHIPHEHLDGDILRDRFPGTGFTRKERDDHIRRVGFMAGLLEKHGVWVVATFVSPYRAARDEVRGMCRNFCEIHVATPLDVCEQRDTKGLYLRARAGAIANFTGISDPYEEPDNPEIRIDTRDQSVAQSARRVLDWIRQRGWLKGGLDL